MKVYIYSYINKINGHRYIGKTNNIERRKREHKSQAFNSKSEYYKALWPSKIREYGYDNFDFEILEVTDEKNWVEREQYWISFYDTYHGVGYNTTSGGDCGDFECLLTEKEAQEIRNLLKTSSINQEDIAAQFGVSSTLISNINQGQKYTDIKEHYPLRKNYKRGLEEYSELIILLKTTTKSFKEIAAELGIAESSVKKINYGKMQYDNNFTYPIRKESSLKQKANEIKNLLLNSNMSFNDIANQTGRSLTSVKRINSGETHFDNNLSYPLRK